MAKVTISEAVGLTGVSESTIRRDIKSGLIGLALYEKSRQVLCIGIVFKVL